MKKYCGIIFFVSGLGVGAWTGYYFTKKKYINQANKDVEAIKRYYKNKYPEPEEADPAQNLKKNEQFVQKAEMFKASYEQDKKRYEDEVKMYSTSAEVTAVPSPQKNYMVISEEEFKESSNDSYTVWRYIDGEVADDEYNLMSNIMEGIGDDISLFFNENPDVETMYIRNIETNVDYEVCYTNEHYSDSVVTPKDSQ